MNFRKALIVGLPVATALHILVFTDHLSSPFLWPGFLAHLLITGLHGDDDSILGAVASLAEIIINGALYATAVVSVVRLIQKATSAQ
jgi:hypothetical protein